MSDSVRSHRWEPTRLPHPWDFPGKNTGVGCHFLLQCMKVKSESEVAQSCPTLHDPMVCSLPGSSIHGIFQARVLEWGAMPFSRGFSSPQGLNPCLLQLLYCRPFFTTEPPEKQERKEYKKGCVCVCVCVCIKKLNHFTVQQKLTPYCKSTLLE